MARSLLDQLNEMTVVVCDTDEPSHFSHPVGAVDPPNAVIAPGGIAPVPAPISPRTRRSLPNASAATTSLTDSAAEEICETLVIAVDDPPRVT